MRVNNSMGKRSIFQTKTMKLKDQRIKLMNEILNGIKVLKLYAWEVAFIRRINDIRGQELACIRQKAVLSAISTAIWTFAPILVNSLRVERYSLKFFRHFRYVWSHLHLMFSHRKRIFSRRKKHSSRWHYSIYFDFHLLYFRVLLIVLSR